MCLCLSQKSTEFFLPLFLCLVCLSVGACCRGLVLLKCDCFSQTEQLDMIIPLDSSHQQHRLPASAALFWFEWLFLSLQHLFLWLLQAACLFWSSILLMYFYTCKKDKRFHQILSMSSSLSNWHSVLKSQTNKWCLTVVPHSSGCPQRVKFVSGWCKTKRKGNDHLFGWLEWKTGFLHRKKTLYWCSEKCIQFIRERNIVMSVYVRKFDKMIYQFHIMCFKQCLNIYISET